MEQPECKHENKAYSSMGITLTVYPPINISHWICKDCGFEGTDSEQGLDLDAEYRATKNKFNK